MKRLFLIPLLAAIVGLAVSLTAANPKSGNSSKQYSVYGVAFYNLENLFDTINNNGKYDEEFSPNGGRQWNGKKYWSKIHNMAYCISQMTTKTTPMGPAVIGVAEIENKSVLVDLVNDPQIKQWNLQIVHHDSPDRRGVDVSLLFNPRMFRLIGVSNHRLTIDGNPGFRTRDQMCATGIMGGDTVSVIVNHWPSRLGGEEQSSHLREAAAALSKKIADSIWVNHPGRRVIIMGDLNDDPMNRSCAKVLGAAKSPDGVGAHGFYNPWWKMLADDGVGTLAYKGQWNLFDQIIISGNLLPANANGGLEYWNCKVLNFDFLRDKEGPRQGYPLRTFSGGAFLNGYSDHFPTEIFLRKERTIQQ